MANSDDKLAENLGCGDTKMSRKKRLREELKNRLGQHLLTNHSDAVLAEIREYLRNRPGIRVVATFSALPGEVDLRELCGAEGRVWVYPKVVGSELVFCRVHSFEADMELGKFGIREPYDGAEKYCVEEVDLFLCPGLSFDVTGGRLGRGKGFYDRALARARADAMKWGVCFGWQMVDEVVMEEHDVKMDGVFIG